MASGACMVLVASHLDLVGVPRRRGSPPRPSSVPPAALALTAAVRLILALACPREGGRAVFLRRAPARSGPSPFEARVTCAGQPHRGVELGDRGDPRVASTAATASGPCSAPTPASAAGGGRRRVAIRPRRGEVRLVRRQRCDRQRRQARPRPTARCRLAGRPSRCGTRRFRHVCAACAALSLPRRQSARARSAARAFVAADALAPARGRRRRRRAAAWLAVRPPCAGSRCCRGLLLLHAGRARLPCTAERAWFWIRTAAPLVACSARQRMASELREPCTSASGYF